MPKLDPDDDQTTNLITAPAPLPAGQTSTTSPAPSTGFGTTAPGFGAVPPASSGFGNAPLGGNSASTSGFGSPAPASSGGFGGSSSFGGSAGGFGGSSSFGGSTGGFGGSSMGGGFGGGMGGQQNFGGQQGQYQQTDTHAFSEAIAASADKPEEHWMKSYWRPAMGWLYMLTCFCDFILFPILWSMMQAYIHGAVNQQWNPVTLQGAGLFHLAMGAILGIAAYGRTQEKKAGAS